MKKPRQVEGTDTLSNVVRCLTEIAPEDLRVLLIGSAALASSDGDLKRDYANRDALTSLVFRMNDYIRFQMQRGHTREDCIRHLQKRISEKPFREIVSGAIGSSVSIQPLPENIREKSFVPDTHLILHNGVPVLTARLDRMGRSRHLAVKSAIKTYFGQHIGMKSIVPAKGHLGWKRMRPQDCHEVSLALEKEFAPDSIQYTEYTTHKHAGETFFNRIGDMILTDTGFVELTEELEATINGSLSLDTSDAFSCLNVSETVTLTSRKPLRPLTGELNCGKLRATYQKLALDADRMCVGSLSADHCEIKMASTFFNDLDELYLSGCDISVKKKLHTLSISELTVKETKSFNDITKVVKADDVRYLNGPIASAAKPQMSLGL